MRKLGLCFTVNIICTALISKYNLLYSKWSGTKRVAINSSTANTDQQVGVWRLVQRRKTSVRIQRVTAIFLPTQTSYKHSSAILCTNAYRVDVTLWETQNTASRNQKFLEGRQNAHISVEQKHSDQMFSIKILTSYPCPE